MRPALCSVLLLTGCLVPDPSDTDEPAESETTASASAADAPNTDAPDTDDPSGTPDAEADGDTTQGDPSPAEDTADSTGAESEDSRCEVTPLTLTCTHQTTTLLTGTTGLAPREVHWQVPLGEPPPGGWPAVLMFQGSIFTAELFWAVLDTDTLGMWNQGMLTKTLLDEGFAVVTPEAHLEGFTAWDTNIPPMSEFWELASDHWFMLDIFDAIEDGTFGPIDPDQLFATGISSGGYMTSRMDEAYRERFVALAIQSASWATCSGPICSLPGDLDAGHLPTLFLHGSDDAIVPIWTMELYRDALDQLGVPTETIVQAGVGHAWIDQAPEAITAWFLAH